MDAEEFITTGFVVAVEAKEVGIVMEATCYRCGEGKVQGIVGNFMTNLQIFPNVVAIRRQLMKQNLMLSQNQEQ